MKKIITMILLVIFSVSLFIGCTEVNLPPQSGGNTDTGKAQTLETSQKLKKFNSVQEIKDYIDESSKGANYYGGYSGGMRNGGVMMESLAMDTVGSSAPMAKTSSQSSGGGATDFSQTNVQIEGVDEADFVKNDDKYIYALSQDKLVIVDAYPAEDAEILSKTEIDGYPRNLFVNGDRLVVFSSLNDEVLIIPEYDFMPRQRYTSRTHAYVYDISDRKNPELVNDFNVNGDYYDARMIGDYVYFISRDSIYYYNNYIDMPVMRDGREKIAVPDVFYFDNPESNYMFNTIASFDVNSDEINAKSFLMGYSNTLMVSMDNIYIAYQKNLPWRYYEMDNEDRFFKVVVPLLPNDVQDNIDSIKNEGINSAEKWSKISTVLEDMYNNMEEKEKNLLVEDIQNAIEEYEAKKEIERRKTIIHKIAIDKGDIEYVAKGEISGYLLNQFSMDEYDGNLRLATTTDIWTSRENKEYNNVYVLDEDMELIGSLEEIAPDERIYSTRFIGDRLYMVTFKRIDPLFVIDLSDAKNPSVLGELKIPGFSDYLHPYDENHIIGIGKETADNEFGGTSIKGVKLALFDVSDVSKPKQVDMYEIGTSGTDSEALNEHKAFLFDKEKNLLVIPVREITGERERNLKYGYYQQKVWQGAYVFHIDEEGFQLEGKISHYSGDEESRWYWGSPYAVRRSLFMDDVLYTVSAKKIVMNDLGNIDDEINSIDLPYKQDVYYPVYY